MPQSKDSHTGTSPASRADLIRDPEAVVFVGDGEPQRPESTVKKLGELLESGQLQSDTYSIGGSVEAFEKRMADELGKEAAIWMPTGTLANHLALRRHAGTKARVILQEQSHIYQDEGDALARLSGLNAVPLGHNSPVFTTDELRQALERSVSGRVLNPVGAVSVESPVRRQAGQVVPLEEMRSIAELCRREEIPVHLDGARLYMMSAATGIDVKTYAGLFDSVYVSTWKYFGSPFGAILAGDSSLIEGMFHDRRLFGGGLPSGYLAASLSHAGIDGFESRFKQAFLKAQELFSAVDRLDGITVRSFEHGSNIFELDLDPAIDAETFANRLANQGIYIMIPNPEWPVPLLHVNPTVLRRTNEDIVNAFDRARTSN